MTTNPGNIQRIHPVIDTPLGRMIRERRLAMGLSQSALARALDWDHAHVSRIESGTRQSSIERVPDIARVLGLDVADIALALCGLDPATVRQRFVRQAHSATLDTVITTLTELRDAPAHEAGEVAA